MMLQLVKPSARATVDATFPNAEGTMTRENPRVAGSLGSPAV
jgi:hypothetical protein